MKKIVQLLLCCLFLSIVASVLASAEEVTVNVETKHPYVNNQYSYQMVYVPGAKEIRVHFVKLELVDDGTDLLLTNYNGTQQLTDFYYAQDNKEDFWTEWRSGDSIFFSFYPSRTRNAYGFKVDKVEVKRDTPVPEPTPDPVPPTPVPPANDTLPVTGQAIQVGTGQDMAVDDHFAVWSNGGIIVCNLTDGTTQQIAASGSHPRVSGSVVAFLNTSTSSPAISIYDLTTGSTRSIVSHVDEKSRPDISGSGLVWSTDGHLYLYDLATGWQIPLGNGSMPEISEGRIIYVYDGYNDTEVHLLDLGTGDDRRLSSGGLPGYPHLSGNYAIWSDLDTRSGHIILYDLITGKETELTSGISDSGQEGVDCGEDTGFHTDINGNLIVYSKVTTDCLGQEGIYVYDLTSKLTTRIASAVNGTSAAMPEIYDHTIAWSNTDLYGNTTAPTAGVFVYGYL
jgi:hypothetical protein